MSLWHRGDHTQSDNATTRTLRLPPLGKRAKWSTVLADCFPAAITRASKRAAMPSSCFAMGALMAPWAQPTFSARGVAAPNTDNVAGGDVLVQHLLGSGNEGTHVAMQEAPPMKALGII